MSDRYLENKARIYRRESEQIENYLIKCMSLFINSGIEVRGKDNSKLTLSDWIETSIKVMKATAQHNTDRTENKTAQDSLFIKGINFAYMDCMRILINAADDMEMQHPKNKKIMHVATSYRHIVESIQHRGTLIEGMESEELDRLKKGRNLH